MSAREDGRKRMMGCHPSGDLRSPHVVRNTWGRSGQKGVWEVSCWCDESIVLVPTEVFDEGRTLSCGRATCKEPA